MIIVLSIVWVFAFDCFAQTDPIVAVAGGERHSIALTQDGAVWGWGANGSGQLGDGILDDSYIPTRVVDPADSSGYLSGISAIAAGSSYWLNFGGHNLAVKDDGTVWAWGYGVYGQLGDGADVSRSTPVQVVHTADAAGFLTGVAAVAAGDLHSLALKSNGTVWAWGFNDHGRLGDGTTVARNTAVQVSGLTDVIQIAGGGAHSMALTSDGTVWTWGANPNGELGDGTWGFPFSKTTPVQVVHPADASGFLTDIVAIAAGDFHSLALKSDGTLWAWGANLDGQLGDGANTNQVTPVQVVDPADGSGFLTGVAATAGGDKFTIARKTNGEVWTWGNNNWGQLGDGTTVGSNTPKAMASLSGIVYVDAGNGHSLAVDQDGKVWAWGGNWSGQLGDGTAVQRTDPVQTVFPDDDRTSLLKVIGHALVTPGEEATFVIDYENILEEVLDECVVVVDLPSEFDYASSTNRGNYWKERHQVFWRLGDVDPGGKGILAVKVSVQWGLAAHDTTNLSAEIGAHNLDATFNLDDYVDHTDIGVVAERNYSSQEIASLLSTNSELTRLYDHALERGFRFDGIVTEYEMSDGSFVPIMMMINPDPFGPVYLTASGDTGYMQVFDETGMSMLDENGGYTEDLEGNTRNTWGTWAQSNSPQQYKCIGNCVFNSVKNWGVYIRDVYKGNKRLACSVCRESFKKGNWDSQQCGYCAELYANFDKKRYLKYRKPISKCISQCEDNPYEWQCLEGRVYDSCVATYGLAVSAITAGRFTSAWHRHICKDGKWKGGSTITKEECTDRNQHHAACLCHAPQVCRQTGNKAKCEDKCEDPKSSSSIDINLTHTTLYAPSQAQEDDAICAANLTSHDIMFVYAHDPNAKSVDVPGDVLPGQNLTYTLEYENEGTGTAFGVFILDELDANLNEATLVVNNNGDYSDAARLLSWDIGELDPGEQGAVTFSVDVKDSLPSGTEIINIADVHFPSADEITPTNPVVTVVNSIAADPQTVSTVAGNSLGITITGRDEGSNPLTFNIVEGPSFGILTGSAPNITYTPMDEFSGQDAFTYLVNNGVIDSGPATVRINVTPDPSDNRPPKVIETYPLAGAKNIPVSHSSVSQNPDMYKPVIKATFSEPVDADTITATTFTIDGLSGTVVYDQQTRTALFSPSSVLAYGTTYTARLKTGIKDLAGNALLSEYTWQFTTQSQVNIVASLPGDADTAEFPEVRVNNASDELILSIINTGPQNLQISSIHIVGSDAADFRITEDNCSGATLPEFENEIVKLEFKPLSTGSKQTTLSILSNDPDTPDLRIQMSGKGVEPVADFVTRFYKLCLSRDPDPPGLAGWVEALLNGSLTGSDVAFGFVFSPEFLNKKTNNEQYLQILYEAFFNRQPDPGGWQTWLEAFQNGATREHVLNGFVYAIEFANLCDTYGIKAYEGHITKKARDAVKAFVTRFYQLCLGRDPDAPGLEQWSDNLLNRIQTGADVANGFINSQEFINKNTSNDEYLTILYKAFFNRDPDQAGWDVWIAELNSGTDRGHVLDGFLGSQEFIKLCEDYGITPF
jgi:uncharacterized repeat protein (TIGR01451 family)